MSDALTSFLDEPNSSFEKVMNKRQEEETMENDRKEIQALHAAISRRDWHAVEVAANVLRDQEARPAAPVEGLEKVSSNIKIERFRQNWHDEIVPDENGDYCYYDETEAIIAAKDESIKDAKLSRDDWKELAKKLEADNAALTARVKELEGNLEELERDIDQARLHIFAAMEAGY